MQRKMEIYQVKHMNTLRTSLGTKSIEGVLTVNSNILPQVSL